MNPLLLLIILFIIFVIIFVSTRRKVLARRKVLIVFIILVVAVGFFIWLWEFQRCESEKDQEKRDSCYLDEVMSPVSGLSSQKRISTCEKIISSEKKDKCYWNVAHFSPELCEKISVPSYQYDSIHYIDQSSFTCKTYEQLGLYSQDEINKISCYLWVAEQLNEEFPCEKISDRCWRDFCYAKLIIWWRLYDLSLCGKIDNQCIKNLCEAVVRKDSSICEKVAVCEKNPEVRRDDTDICYLEIAKLTNDPTLCEKIYYSPKKNECYSAIEK